MHLNINSPGNKFESISELIKVKFNIFLINETKLVASFPSNQFAMFDYKLVRKDLGLFGDEIPFFINDQLPSRAMKIENPSDIEILKFSLQGYTNHVTLVKTILLLVLKPL